MRTALILLAIGFAASVVVQRSCHAAQGAVLAETRATLEAAQETVRLKDERAARAVAAAFAARDTLEDARAQADVLRRRADALAADRLRIAQEASEALDAATTVSDAVAAARAQQRANADILSAERDAYAGLADECEACQRTVTRFAAANDSLRTTIAARDSVESLRTLEVRQLEALNRRGLWDHLTPQITVAVGFTLKGDVEAVAGLGWRIPLF